MVYLTRRAEFSASHYYHNPELTLEDNRRIFGKSNNPHGHGHNYTLEVTVAGDVDPSTGMVLDLKDLKKLLEAEVLRLMDHRFLNKEVPVFARKIPTTENLAIEIWNLLVSKLPVAKLHRIRLYESPELYVDYYGDE
jgi:6-pyruvoyltetrahydropterin/6-carboxytetrahydropterin synthase